MPESAEKKTPKPTHFETWCDWRVPLKGVAGDTSGVYRHLYDAARAPLADAVRALRKSLTVRRDRMVVDAEYQAAHQVRGVRDNIDALMREHGIEP